VGDGIQQAIEYAEALRVPFVFSSIGDGFVFRDGTREDGSLRECTLRCRPLLSSSESWPESPN
jgi:type I restriction enzyme R subunit